MLRVCHSDGHVLEAAGSPLIIEKAPLRLDASRFRILMEAAGPSLGLWRGAEIAALREVDFQAPVLDVGCGDGLVSSLALWLVDVGLDPNEDAISRAKKSGIYERLMKTTIEEAELPDESAASVLCNSVIEHAPSVKTVLGAIHRVLRPGGMLALTCPTRCFSDWLALPNVRYAKWRNQKLEHVTLLSAQEWTDHLEKAGFSVIRIRPYLRRRLVFVWDLLELLQLVRVRQRPVFSRLWKKSPSLLLDCFALMASRFDLSSPEPGGGQLILAVKK